MVLLPIINIGTINHLKQVLALTTFDSLNLFTMTVTQMIFWRNFLLRTFLIGILLALLMFVLIRVFWSTWVTAAVSMVHVEEPVLAQAVVQMFMEMRIVIIFFLIAPALALHWMIRGRKE
jgi:hypothetical protein